MKTFRYAAIAAAIAFGGFAAPAAADPIYVSNVQVNWNQGEGLSIDVNSSPMAIYYAGPITYTMNPGTSYNAATSMSEVVWCDDLYNEVYIGSQDQYQTGSVSSYLSPIGSAQTIHDIIGLAFMGTIWADNNHLTSAQGAEIQVAIWELEYGNINAPDHTFQTAVDTLIADAHGYYHDFSTMGYGATQLDTPCGNGGTITFQTACQIQGQLLIYCRADTRHCQIPGPNFPVPEPMTLGLLGAGLVGAGALRRRRKPSKS